MHVVEVDPRNADNSQALESRTILYRDSEVWDPLYEDAYDCGAASLWQNHIYWLTYRDRPVPGSARQRPSIRSSAGS